MSVRSVQQCVCENVRILYMWQRIHNTCTVYVFNFEKNSLVTGNTCSIGN